MKKSSKILILALCVILLLCGTVIAITAADGNVCKVGDKEYASISDAVAEAASGATIKLTANTTINAPIAITKSLTIDLNGKTLTASGEAFKVAHEKVEGDQQAAPAAVTDPIKFTIKGNGYIKANSQIVNAAEDADVEITGTNQGIVIEHTGSTVIMATDTVCVKLTNVHLFATAQSSSYFALSGNARFYGDKLNIESLYVHTSLTYNVGVPFLLKDSIYINLKDSSIITNGTAFIGSPKYNAYRTNEIKAIAGYADINGDAIVLDNVNITAGRAVIFFGDNITNYFGYEDDNADSTSASNNGYDYSAFGKFTIKGGTLTTSYRPFVCNFSQDNVNNTPEEQFSMHVEDATIRALAAYKHEYKELDLDNDGVKETKEYQYVKDSFGNEIPKYVNDGYLFIRKNLVTSFVNCRIQLETSSLAANGGSVKDNNNKTIDYINNVTPSAITLKVGTRFTTKPTTNFVFEDGKSGDGSEYEIVFDATGDREFPWVVIKKGSADVIPYKQYFMPIYNLRGEYFEDYSNGFPNNEYFQEITGQNGMKVKAVESFTIEIDNNKGSYGKYTLYSDEYAYGDIAKMTDFPSTSDDGKWDSFYVIGSTNKSDHANSLKLSASKVIVYNINFSAGTEWGYVDADLYCGFRGDTYTNPDNANKITLKIENNVLYNANDRNKYIELDPFTWYNLTILLDVEKNVSSFYIDGELFASGQVYKPETTYSENAYFQGLRFGPHGNVDQVMGSSLIFDNVSGAAYNTSVRNGTNLDVSKYVDLDNSGKKVSLSGETGSAASFKANGIYYTDLNSALEYGVAILEEDNPYETTTTKYDGQELVYDRVSGYIYTKGNTLKIDKNSHAMNISGDASDYLGLVASIDPSLDNTTLDVYFYIGGTNGNLSDLTDTNNYVKDTIKPGHTPKLPDGVTVGKAVNREKHVVGIFNGEFAANFNAKTPITLNPISANEIKYYIANGEFLTYYAFYDYAPLDFEVTNSANPDYYDGGVGGDSFYEALTNIKNGDTIKLLNDITVTGKDHVFYKSQKAKPTDIAIDDDYTPEELAALKNYADKIAIDLAGNTLDWVNVNGNKKALFVISSNTVLSLYSSQPGGVIQKLGYNTGTAIENLRAFSIANESGGETWGAYNAHIEIGTYNGMYKGNITTYTATLAEACSGDSSCSINVGGGTFVRATSDSNSLFLFRVYNGSMTLSDGIFLMGHSNLFQARNAKGKDNTTDHKTTVYTADNLPYGIKQKVLVENSYILGFENTTTTGDKNLMDNPGISMNVGGYTTYSTFTLKNVYTNLRVGPGEVYNKHIEMGNGKVFVEGAIYTIKTKGNTLAFANAATDGFKQVTVNMPFTLPGGVNYIVYPTQWADKNVVTKGYGVFAINPDSVPSEYTNIVRPTDLPDFFEIAITTPDNIVNVSFKDGNGNVLDAGGEYAKGSTVTYNGPAIPDVTNVSSVYANRFVGWSASLENVQENTVFTPVTEKVLHVEGIKLALSLYSDFSINLYIPAALVDGGYLTSTGSHKMLTNKVTIDSAEYYVLSERFKPYEATHEVTFNLTFKDGDFEDTYSVTYSILKYAETILAGNYSAEDKSFVAYILDYVLETYKYIAVNHTPYADEINAVTSVINAYPNVKIAQGEFTFANKVDTSALGSAFDGATVMLSSAPKFALALKDGFKGTVTVSYTKKNQTAATLTFTEADAVSMNGVNYIIIEGMKACEFSGNITINATGTVGADAVAVTDAVYNLDTFASYHNENAANADSSTQAESQKCLALVNAFYAFVKAATDYVAQ